MRKEKLTVGALKKALKGVSNDTVIVIAIDPEGNAYRAIEDATSGYSFDEQTTGFGEIGLTELDETLKLAGYSEDDVMEGGVPCLLLWPL
jgi:hypothetical protein